MRHPILGLCHPQRMNHERVYHNLMKSRQALGRKKRHDGSLERHHVKSKCLGGSDEPENLVLLTPT